MLSEASTIGDAHRQEEKVILVSDVSRAFFEAPATRKIAVMLPEEALDYNEKGRSMVGIFEDVIVRNQRRRGKLPEGGLAANGQARFHPVEV